MEILKEKVNTSKINVFNRNIICELKKIKYFNNL